MRLFLLFLALSIGGMAASAHAQPVMLEAQPLPGDIAAPPDAASTPALPNLTPDIIEQHTYGFTPPADLPDRGQSTVNPRMEPWEKPRRPDRARQAEEIFAKLPYETQSQILDETYDVHRQCNVYQTYAQFHDCDCIGSVYFEERVFDPESSRDAIVGRVSSACVSLPGAAAFGYDQCVAGMRYVLVPARADDFCKCFALQFGKNYQQSPYPNFDNIRALSKRTNDYCIRSVPYAFQNQIR